MDYDKANQVVGIEVLYLSKRPHPVNFQFETRLTTEVGIPVDTARVP